MRSRMLSVKAESNSTLLCKSRDMSATVRINPDTHAKLKELCHQTGETVPVVLDKAIREIPLFAELKPFLNDFREQAD